MASYQSSNLIPWTPETRSVPVKILIVGLWRTGTSSLLQALQTLGYHNTYPRDSPSPNTWNSLSYNQAWNRVIDSKFLDGNAIPRETFDELMGDCMVISGVPCQLFLDDLLAAYPDAKVILTARDMEKWYPSIINSFEYISTRSIFRVAALFNTFVRERSGYLDRVKYWGYYDNLPVFAKLVHKNHVEKVRLLVEAGRIRKEDYLELEVGHGWRPLCDFSSAEMQEGEYPRVNDLKSVRKMFWQTLVPRAWWIAVRGVGSWVVPFVVLGAGWWLRGGSGRSKFSGSLL